MIDPFITNQSRNFIQETISELSKNREDKKE